MSLAPTLRTTHLSGLHALQKELAALRQELLRQHGDEGRALRVAVLTLVVACTSDEEADQADAVVDSVVLGHPARVVVVVARPQDDPGVTAQLGLRCSSDRGGAPVCAEVVRLHVGGEAALHLTSVVGPLLLSDVPVVLWVVGAPRLAQALSPRVARLCSRVIVDGDAFADAHAVLSELAVAVTRQTDPTPLADLAWARGAAWREQVARLFDLPALRGWAPRLRRVSAAGAQGLPAAGGRLVGGWAASRAETVAGRVELEWEVDPEVGGRGDLVRLRLDAEGRLRRDVVVERGPDQLHTQARIDGRTVAELSSPLRRPTLVDLVGSLLGETGTDPLYLAALRRATR